MFVLLMRSGTSGFVWLGFFNQIVLYEIGGCWKAVTTFALQKE